MNSVTTGGKVSFNPRPENLPCTDVGGLRVMPYNSTYLKYRCCALEGWKEKPLKDGAEFTLTPEAEHLLSQPCSEKAKGIVRGFTTPTFPVIDRNCVHNAYRAIRNRVVQETALLDLKVLEKYQAFVAKKFQGMYPQDIVQPASIYEWLSTLDRKKFLKYFAEVSTSVLQTGQFGPRPLTHKDFQVSAFVKTEMLPQKIKVKNEPEGADPRIISARSAPFTLSNGPWIKQVCHALGDWWNGLNPNLPFDVCYAIGKTPEQLGAWFDAKREKFAGFEYSVIEIDYSRYDASLRSEVLLTTEAAYRRMGVPEWCVKLLRKNCYNKMGEWHDRLVPKAQLRYKVPGTRASGDNQTSVDNSMINASLLAFALDGLEWACIVLGDDNLVFVKNPEQGHVQKSLEILEGKITGLKKLGMGITYKVFPMADERLSSFCSGYFFPVVDRKTKLTRSLYVPKLGRTLLKTGCTSSSPANELEMWQQWIGTVAQRAIDYSAVPILRTFYAQQVTLFAGRMGVNANVVSRNAMVKQMALTARQFKHKLHAATVYDTSPEAFVLLERLYGLPLLAVEGLEKALRQLDEINSCILHPALDHIISTDYDGEIQLHNGIDTVYRASLAYVSHPTYDKYYEDYGRVRVANLSAKVSTNPVGTLGAGLIRAMKAAKIGRDNEESCVQMVARLVASCSTPVTYITDILQLAEDCGQLSKMNSVLPKLSGQVAKLMELWSSVGKEQTNKLQWLLSGEASTLFQQFTASLQRVDSAQFENPVHNQYVAAVSMGADNLSDLANLSNQLLNECGKSIRAAGQRLQKVTAECVLLGIQILQHALKMMSAWAYQSTLCFDWACAEGAHLFGLR